MVCNSTVESLGWRCRTALALCTIVCYHKTMSIERIGGVSPEEQPRLESVNLYKPHAYELKNDALYSKRSMFDLVAEGFMDYLRDLSDQKDGSQAREASYLLNILETSNGELIVDILRYQLDGIDWTDETPIDNVEELFGTLLKVRDVIFNPKEHYIVDGVIYSYNLGEFEPDEDEEADRSPLAKYTRKAFQDSSLTARHGSLWTGFIEMHVANRYVRGRSAEVPSEMSEMDMYFVRIRTAVNEQTNRVGDPRSVGIMDLLDSAMSNLKIIEKEDPELDYGVRLELARELLTGQAENKDLNPEKALETVLKYMEPVGLDINNINGPLFREVEIKRGDNIVYRGSLRFDSFWFKDPSEGSSVYYGDTGFPDKPKILDIPMYPYQAANPSEYRFLPDYKDPSYFRPDGSKVYWGDLTKNDIKRVKGVYFCLSQGDSFHRIPPWAAVMKDLRNEDPNRPAQSILNTPEGEALLPADTIWVDQDYIRLVAIGVIADGKFVRNPSSSVSWIKRE